MPGYILHLTAAKMLLELLPEASYLCRDPKERNDFYAGCLLPDTVKDKADSHFRNPKYKEQMIEYPDLSMFCEKYGSLLKDSSCFGYYFHLYVDYRFYHDYLPSILEFLDEDGNQVTKRDQVLYIYMKQQKRKMPRKEFYTDEFYYGDYTRMNTYLVERYDLPISLDLEILNPGIEEVDYKDLKNVMEELKGYLEVPSSMVEELQVFNMEDVLSFLEKITFEFKIKQYLKIHPENVG